MWTSTIERKGFSNGQFWVMVKYSDGNDSFEEQVTLSNEAHLHAAVRSRLEVLKTVNEFANSIPTGAFVPDEEVKIEPTEYELALGEVTRLKGLISVGVIKEDDAEYVAALANLKKAYAELP